MKLAPGSRTDSNQKTTVFSTKRRPEIYAIFARNPSKKKINILTKVGFNTKLAAHNFHENTFFYLLNLLLIFLILLFNLLYIFDMFLNLGLFL